VTASDEPGYDLGDGPRDRSLRVGDKERDAVGAILRQRHLEGRLDTDELQARLERCLTAKTYSDLDALIADFPRREPARRRAARQWAWRPWPIAFPFLPLGLIAAVAFGFHFAWIAFPLFFFFVVRPLMWRSRRGYGRASWHGSRRTM
jgi:hypothetical protein